MAVACGFAHTLAFAERGCRVFAFACGCGNPGQLGAGTREDQDVLARVAGLEGRPEVVLLAADYEHAVAITSEGVLRVLGAKQVRRARAK